MLYIGSEPGYMGITTHQLLQMFLNGHTQTVYGYYRSNV